MPAKLEEIEASYIGQRYRFDSCIIGEVEIPANGKPARYVTIKGDADEGELSQGQRYRFYGRFANYTNRRTGEVEKQFHFQTFVAAVSHDRESVVAYLSHAGKGLGVGKGTAERAFDKWGAECIEAIRQDGRILQTISKRITPEQCDAIQSKLIQQQATEDATIELTGLLAGRGLPKSTARSAIKEWGNKAAEKVRRDPYALMTFRGCGFKLCDSLYLEMGHDPARLRRQALCAWYSIASQSSGDIWYPATQVVRSIESLIGPGARPRDAIRLAMRLGRMSPDHYGAMAGVKTDGMGGPIQAAGSMVWLAEGRAASNEETLAGMIARAMHEGGKSLWPDPATVQGIDEHQRAKLAEALTSRVAVLGGSPGTGKTYTVAMLIRSLLKSGMVGPNDIAIGAPTGKAAVRLTEALQTAGVPIAAKTWHSHLGIGNDDSRGGWSFQHNAKNPWPYRVLIGDESSMNDTSLMKAIFAARARGCHVLLVGDVNQLPPVGSGAPLRDIIASGVCGYGELTEIKRNSGGIVEACAAIRDGNRWEQGNNLTLIDATNETATRDALRLINSALAKGFDPIWDCQIIVAVNEKSELSRAKINRILQSELNPNPAIQGTPFRLHDKIVCTKNGKYPPLDRPKGDDSEVYVANGELAEVVDIEPKRIVAKLRVTGELIVIPRGKGDGDDASTGCNFDLAYGMTCHKLQGSECPIVIVMLDDYPGARRVCSREWLYTAISRAKAHCYLLGKRHIADAMCRNQAIWKRKTLLRERIQLALATKEMEGMF